MGARSNGFGTWIREGGRKSGGVNRGYLKNGGCMARAAPLVLAPVTAGKNGH